MLFRSVASGSYRLMVESKESGAASDFTLTQADGSALLGGATVRAGTDAAIDLGTGITATSTSNTFTGLFTGLDLTLGADATVGSTATVTVSRDSSSMAKSVSSMVDSINDILKTIDSGSAYNSTTKTAGVLMGESSVRNLRDRLLDTVYAGDGSSLASLGISVTRDGLLSFDSDTFTSAYTADPTAVTAKFDNSANGFVERVRTMAKGASDSVDGVLTSAIDGRNSEIKRLNDSISEWDDRLTLRRSTLERQFTALETALNQMNNQSSWISGQLSSLASG